MSRLLCELESEFGDTVTVELHDDVIRVLSTSADVHLDVSTANRLAITLAAAAYTAEFGDTACDGLVTLAGFAREYVEAFGS